ncbi:MAG: hypothetical protein AB203_00690 [Parcubacteria bacterium C7867-008]|nr:MAG: hypothetical protein AB203_00690 [Parcubacteria bacterium C7867-008]
MESSTDEDFGRQIERLIRRATSEEHLRTLLEDEGFDGKAATITWRGQQDGQPTTQLMTYVRNGSSDVIYAGYAHSN